MIILIKDHLKKNKIIEIKKWAIKIKIKIKKIKNKKLNKIAKKIKKTIFNNKN